MTVTELVPNQFWQVRDFFDHEQLQKTKSLYRETRMPFNMVYDNRLLTDYNTTPELQEIVASYAPWVSNLVGEPVDPQVAYISIDLPDSSIMMHRLHNDIVVQLQVCLGKYHDLLGYSMCTDAGMNSAQCNDYNPTMKFNKANTATAEYYPGSANVFYNQPRAFVGMLDRVPANHIREVLVMSFQRKGS